MPGETHDFFAETIQGGYNFSSISKSALAVTRTLMGEPPDRMKPTKATEAAMDTVLDVKMTQSRHWNCMHYQGLWMLNLNFVTLVADFNPDMVDGMTDTVRLDGRYLVLLCLLRISSVYSAKK